MARGRGSRGGKVIDSVRWLAMTAQVAARSAGSTGVTVLSTTQLGTVGQTILRSRGVLTAWIDTTSITGLAATISCGMHLVPDGTGTTVTVNPFDDPASDWFWYSAFTLGYEEMVTDVVDVPGITSYREIVDSKAMRRRKGNEEIQFVVNNTSFLGVLAINIALDGRILVGQ